MLASGYQQYNTVAKKLDRRLAALGSAALLVKGLGDDQHFSGYDSALFPWLEQLWPALRKLWPHKDLSVLPGACSHFLDVVGAFLRCTLSGCSKV